MFQSIFFFCFSPLFSSSKCVRFLRSLFDSSVTSELHTLDFNNEILRCCPPQISAEALDAFCVLPKTSASSPRKRLTRQFLKDKSAVCTHANDARPSGKSAGWESVYRGRALSQKRREITLFSLCWLSRNKLWKKQNKTLVTPKQFHHCFYNSVSPSYPPCAGSELNVSMTWFVFITVPPRKFCMYCFWSLHFTLSA